MKTKSRNDYTINAVVEALQLLDEFLNSAAELGVTQLSANLKFTKNKVFRLLATLESQNFIKQNEQTGKYSLGVKNYLLGNAYLRQFGLIKHARNVLEQIVKQCNETASISVMNNGLIVCIDSVETNQPVRAVNPIGLLLPVNCTSEGKVFASCMDRKLLEGTLSSDPKNGKNTEHDVNHRILEIENVTVTGYAVEIDEFVSEVSSISAPIYDHNHAVVAVVSISGPSSRITLNRIENELIALIKSSAEEISRSLGLM